MSTAARKQLKVSPKYYEPHQVIQKKKRSSGTQAAIINHSPIHHALHVSLLKKRFGHAIQPQQQFPLAGEDGQNLVQPCVI